MIDQNEPTTNDIDPSSPSIDSELPAIKKYKANPNRKKREAKVNPEYEAAIIKIMYMFRRESLNTQSAVIEHIFNNKSFTRNECDAQISEINSHLTGYKKQYVNLYDYFIDLAYNQNVQPTQIEIKTFTNTHNIPTKEKLGQFFHAQLKFLTTNINLITDIDSSIIEDDTPEVQAIKNLFINGDIKANLPERRNIAYRLDTDLDYKYFGALKGKQNSGENRRVLEQVLIHNTHFLLETSNRKHIKFLQNIMDAFNKDLTYFNTEKTKGVKTGLDIIYNKLVSYNNRLASYAKEVSDGNT